MKRNPSPREIIDSRPDWVNKVEQLKSPQRKQRVQRRPGETVSVSFALTKDLDHRLHDLAIKKNQSRSTVVRQALTEYILRHEEKSPT